MPILKSLSQSFPTHSDSLATRSRSDLRPLLGSSSGPLVPHRYVRDIDNSVWSSSDVASAFSANPMALVAPAVGGKVHRVGDAHDAETGTQVAAASGVAALAVCQGPPARLAALLGAQPAQWLFVPPKTNPDGSLVSTVKTNKFVSDIYIKSIYKEIRPLTVSTLRGTSGKSFYASQTMAAGSFGSVRFAVDAEGNRCAVKMVRVRPKLDAFGKKLPMKTNVSAEDKVTLEQDVYESLGMLRDVIKDGDKTYLVTDYKAGDGESFMKNMAIEFMDTPLRTAIVTRLLVEMTQGLAVLHTKGWVHRDIKLENFLYDANGNMLPIDFGLAEKADESTGYITSVASGTLLFMAPEVIAAEHTPSIIQTATVDTWSVGMVAAAAWTNRLNPFAYCLDAEEVFETCASFSTWRQKLIVPPDSSARPNAPDFIDLTMVGAVGGDWDNYFAPMRRGAPDLLRFILTDLLQPDPARRATMEDARDDVALLLKYPIPRQTSEELDLEWHQEASRVSPDKEAVFAGLDQYREADHLSGDVG